MYTFLCTAHCAFFYIYIITYQKNRLSSNQDYSNLSIPAFGKNKKKASIFAEAPLDKNSVR
jgi:hypothetical protein